MCTMCHVSVHFPLLCSYLPVLGLAEMQSRLAEENVYSLVCEAVEMVRSKMESTEILNASFSSVPMGKACPQVSQFSESEFWRVERYSL